MEPKKPWQSKTVWVNVVMGVSLALAPLVPGGQAIHEWVGGHLDLIGMVWAGLNVALRFITKERITLGD
jgi:hypothetical protein